MISIQNDLRFRFVNHNSSKFKQNDFYNNYCCINTAASTTCVVQQAVYIIAHIAVFATVETLHNSRKCE